MSRLDTRLTETEIAAALRRALHALAGAGAYGFEEHPGGSARLIIVAPRKGVSVRVGVAQPRIVAQLLAEGLAVWGNGGDSLRRRLTLTSEGQARAAREHAARDGVDPFLAQHRPLARQPADAPPVPSHPDGAAVFRICSSSGTTGSASSCHTRFVSW